MALASLIRKLQPFFKVIYWDVIMESVLDQYKQNIQWVSKPATS